MNPLDQLNELWDEHQVLITVVGAVLAGVAVTSLLAWLLRKIVRPAITLVTGIVTTSFGATVLGFLTDFMSTSGSVLDSVERTIGG